MLGEVLHEHASSWRGSAPAAAGAGANPTFSTLALAAVLTGAFVAGHVPFIRATTDGIDSANFTLAVDRYDPRLHQPHPPGFPVHVALGRVVNDAYRAIPVGEASPGHDTAAAALRMLSVIAGALAVFVVTWIAMMLGASTSRAVAAAALTATCPLFWITAMRPLSDVPGLCFALLSQALALASCRGSGWTDGAALLVRSAPAIRGERFNRALLLAAIVAGVAVGVRVQTLLLTLPLLALATVLEARRSGAIGVAAVSAAMACGVLAWAIPMVQAIGGPAEYLRLLTTVAADDISGVEMVATNPSPRLLAVALFRTLVVPWSSVTLGAGVLLLAISGAVLLALRNARALAVMVLMGLPYLIFHLLFQESASIRYALPVVPVICLAVTAALPARPGMLHTAVAVAVLVSTSALSLNATNEYSDTQSPVARVMADVRRQAAGRDRWPVLAAHHAVGRAMRAQAWPEPVLGGEVRYEWLDLASYWLDGGKGDVWFLADDRRSDLALIDPASRSRLRSYRWPETLEPLLGGAQPLGVSWHRIARPGWFLMRGWSLTAETHGLSRRDRQSPGTSGIAGYIRRRADAAVVMIGGRNIGAPFETGATIEVAIDGVPRAAWVVPPQTPFLRTIALPPGALRGQGPYAELTVRAWDASGTARMVDVAVESFDVQSAGGAMVGYGAGWHFPELDAESGLGWRWADRRAELRAEGFGRDVEIVIRGESPLRYFQTAPRVTVSAGRTELAVLNPAADFEWVVPVPAAALAASEGRLVIETDHTFVPDELHGNGDKRRLALRIYSVEARVK